MNTAVATKMPAFSPLATAGSSGPTKGVNSAGREFAKVWMHNGMLELSEAKMSKSLGNVVTLRNVIDTWGRETLLVYLMSGHYRQPIAFHDEALMHARSQWHAFQAADRVPATEAPYGEWARLAEALDDDFNTAKALAVLHEWRARGYRSVLDRGLQLFGLSIPRLAETGSDVELLKRDRDAARADKDWARADELREQIRTQGFDVVDETTGSRLVPL